MLPEVVTAILAALERSRNAAEVEFTLARSSDKTYYSGQCAAYTLAINLMRNGPNKAMS